MNVQSVEPELLREIHALMDAHRRRCLWFLREDYYPATEAEARRVLDYIQQRGDRDAFRKAGQLKLWLSRSSNARSAA